MDIEHERGDYLTPEQVALAIHTEALLYLASHDGEAHKDAASVVTNNYTDSISVLKANGFLRACMQEDNAGVLKLAKIFPGVDVVRLADALRVEYAIRRLGGRNG